MERFLLTLGMVALVLLAGYGLWHGWRSRARRQEAQLALPELPAAPTELGAPIVPEVTGVYVATTTAGHWQERVVTKGLGRRAACTLGLYPAGALIDRVGEEPIFIPAAALVSADTAPGIAGKVMGMAQGVLLIGWEHGGVALASGIRADRLETQAEWIVATRKLIEATSSAEPTTRTEQ